MMLIQLTGLSGAGKTTLAEGAKNALDVLGYRVGVLDGDICRRQLWPELTFSRQDRQKNIYRLSSVAQLLCQQGVIVFMAAINPYQSVRADVSAQYPNVRTVYVRCDLPTLIRRDTKGLYARALLPNEHPDKLTNLTGINDLYEAPPTPDLLIDTTTQSEAQAIARLVEFVQRSITTDYHRTAYDGSR
ncbi:MAG: adenylyl-sulfate kinase [Spirosoma sp.]|nr:adenylyl-sulfate kinase [Spirosoma sp.]